MSMVEQSALNSRIISFDYDNYLHVDLDELKALVYVNWITYWFYLSIIISIEHLVIWIINSIIHF